MDLHLISSILCPARPHKEGASSVLQLCFSWPFFFSPPPLKLLLCCLNRVFVYPCPQPTGGACVFLRTSNRASSGAVTNAARGLKLPAGTQRQMPSPACISVSHTRSKAWGQSEQSACGHSAEKGCGLLPPSTAPSEAD